MKFALSRQAAAGWAAFGLIVGGLMVWKLGTVAAWVGVVLMVQAGFRLYELLQSFRHAPGTIAVSEQEVVLPRGLCMGKPVTLAPADVTAVYFLRRSVPWNRSAPVLVVEAGGHALAYPRDWFASEIEQRHVVHALLEGVDKDAKRSRELPELDTSRAVWLQLGAGAALLALGVVGASVVTGSATVFVAPIVGGFILSWRALTRW